MATCSTGQLIKLVLARPHAGQMQIEREARRFNVVDCGRRFGKTKYGLNLLAKPMLQGYPVAWFAPTYKTLAEPWRDALKLLKPVIKPGGVSKSERRIELITGGVAEFWSLLDADNIRGRKYKRALIDEAAMVRALKMAWEQVIRPMLSDLIGDAYFFSTPKGRNYFWELFQRALDPQYPNWQHWQLPTSVNPFIQPEEIEDARRELPELVFLQEYLAQFLEDGAGLFRKVLQAAIAELQELPLLGHQYVFGLDWGRSGDFTVISVVDVTLGEQCYLDRFTDISYDIQVGRLDGLFQRFKPTVIVAEANNMGGPLVEQLRQTYPIQPFWTTNATKKEIIDDYALGLEQGSFRILNDRVQIGELLSFEQTKLPSGLWRYAAAGNGHDDTVMAGALSKYAAGRPSPSELVDFA